MSTITIVRRGDGKDVYIRRHWRRKTLPAKKFGRWTVLGRDSAKPRYWVCRCDCGGYGSIFETSLTRGNSTSCGCFQKEGAAERAKRRMTKHDFHAHILYRTYYSIKQRCENPKNDGYKNYGGRGIKCLFKSAMEFVRWGLKSGWEQGLSCDRRDNDGHYSPGNCRWTDWKTQARNTRRNRLVSFGGETKPLCAWIEQLGVNKSTVGTRMYRGRTPEQALGLVP